MNKTNNATAHYIKSTGNKTIWLNYISAEMTYHKKAPKNTRKKERITTDITLYQRRSESVCATVYGNKPWSKMIALFKENQFQLKMMELKDTFSWEILHPSWFLFQSLSLPLSDSDAMRFIYFLKSVMPFLLDLPKLQWRHFPFWTGRRRGIQDNESFN